MMYLWGLIVALCYFVGWFTYPMVKVYMNYRKKLKALRRGR